MVVVFRIPNALLLAQPVEQFLFTRRMKIVVAQVESKRQDGNWSVTVHAAPLRPLSCGLDDQSFVPVGAGCVQHTICILFAPLADYDSLPTYVPAFPRL